VTHLGKYIKHNGNWQPEYVETWRNSRFAFSSDSELMVKTSENPQGELVDHRRWSCVRHMPSAENPYGIALLSSCFWPWTFKHGGFKFFVQLCERFGIPFPVGKYPVGSQDKDIDNLLNGLAKLVQDGIAAIPDDTTIEIIESKLSGEPVPERLVNFCNAEISKALTSQTLATEQKGGGARAASETHAKRAGDNQRSDRALVASFRNQITNALHTVNFDGGEPPKFIFKDKREINSETVTRVRESARLVPIGVDWAYNELGIPKPNDSEAILDIPEESKGIATAAKSEFAKALSNNVELTDEFDVFDHATDDTIKKLFHFAQASKDLDELKQKITSQFPDISTTALAQVAQTAMEYEYMAGMNEANSKTVEIDDE
ncbi:phage portal protein family protein, partial [Pseudoalteromonas nigrifaciens]